MLTERCNSINEECLLVGWFWVVDFLQVSAFGELDNMVRDL